MKIVIITLKHAGKLVKVVGVGDNALKAIDDPTLDAYDLNTATDIIIKSAEEPKEYA